MMFITWRSVMPLRDMSCIVAVGVLVPFVASKTTEREFDFRLTVPPARKNTLRPSWPPRWRTAGPSPAQLHWLAAPAWIT